MMQETCYLYLIDLSEHERSGMTGFHVSVWQYAATLVRFVLFGN